MWSTAADSSTDGANVWLYRLLPHSYGSSVRLPFRYAAVEQSIEQRPILTQIYSVSDCW